MVPLLGWIFQSLNTVWFSSYLDLLWFIIQFLITRSSSVFTERLKFRKSSATTLDCVQWCAGTSSHQLRRAHGARSFPALRSVMSLWRLEIGHGRWVDKCYKMGFSFLTSFSLSLCLSLWRELLRDGWETEFRSIPLMENHLRFRHWINLNQTVCLACSWYYVGNSWIQWPRLDLN